MRIVITNPDSIGDVLLRQPLFAALAAEGHELLLVLRSELSALAPLVAPATSVVLCSSNPYDPRFSGDAGRIDTVLSRIEAFHPDLIAVAPYQRTLLDERIVERFPATRSIALDGFLYPGDISVGLNETSAVTFGQLVPAARDDHELRKAELLCGAILGRSVDLPAPRIRPSQAAGERALERLRRLGLEPGGYWIACVGHNQWTPVRNWRPEDWAHALAEVAEKHKLPLLFIGTPDEAAATDEIRRRMGSAAGKTASLCERPEDLDTLAALIDAGGGYIGKDTGPMHLAAALGKPVVALFGGGTWPRFIPRAETGAALTVSVPCSGCGWVCHLSESHCVKRVPVTTLVEEVGRVLAGEPGFRVIAPEVDNVLLHRMVAESAEVARNRMREAAAQRAAATECRERAEILERRAGELARLLKIADDRLLETEYKRENLEGESKSVRSESERLRELLALLKKDHVKLTKKWEDLSAEVPRLEGALAELQQHHDELDRKYQSASALLDAVRQSIFTKLLRKAGIWRVFD